MGEQTGHDIYVLIQDSSGQEFEMSAEDLAHIWVGATYFIKTVDDLREQVIAALHELDGPPRETTREVLIGVLGTLGLQDSTKGGGR